MAPKIKRIYLGDKMLPRIYQSNVVGSVYSGDFEPSDIAGLAGWWDASTASSLFDAVTGGSPTTANGSVMRWQDLSGNGNHLTQPANDTADAPVRKVADVNTAGKDAVLFDGTNDVLTLANNVDTSGGGSLFIVYKRTADANGGIHSFSGTTDANHHPFAGSFYEGFANGTRRSWVQAYSDAMSLYSVVSGASWVAYLNGLAVNTVAGTTPSAQAAVRPQGFGAGRYLNNAAQDFHAGTYICEAAIYDRALTTAERQKIEGYLAWKWGLQEQLPYDHPYASSFAGFGSQTLPSDPDALAYLSSVASADGTGVEVGVANAIDTFVKGCKSDGIWDSIKASCILAGARTLNGALVPLTPPLGSELWSVSTPSIVNFGGSIGVWDGSTLTMSNSVIGSNASYPRFQFSLPLTIGKRYAVSGTLTGDTSAISTIRLSSLPGASNVSYNSATGAFYATNVPAGAALLEFTTNGTIAYSVSIANLSIRETSGPTNNNFVTADYDRKTGLKGNGSTKYLNSNRANDDDPQDDKHTSAYISTVSSNAATVYIASAGRNTVGSTSFFRGSVTTNWGVNRPSTARVSDVLNADMVGFAGMSRFQASDFEYRANGATNTSTAFPSDTPDPGDLFVMSDGSSYHSDARLAFYSIGEALDLEKLDNRVSRFMAENKFFLNTGLSGKDYDIDTLNYINAGYENGGSIG